MEDERIEFPYYETAYLDDYNTEHIAYVRDDETMQCIKDRFKILNCQLVTQ